ncbi:MAG: alkaline phosphatase, partial [Phenylobacterium sp.]|uniref:alkaline phosphatase n=1 Tax=Phenylobacterium sp. TaxID=1871053 RepID=UPI003BB59DD6
MRPSSFHRPLGLALVAVLSVFAAPGVASAAGLSARQVADPDYRASEAALRQAIRAPAPGTRARNVILFIGDGMGVSTVTAARIFEGQARGVDGASNRLAFDQLPYAAFSKTYSQDALVTDSANGATALLTGVKTLNG